MELIHPFSLAVIGLTWLAAWRVGRRWCVRCGVEERASLWALACVFPTAGLVAAVHCVALVALLTGRGVVTPETVAVAFLAATLLGRRAVGRPFAWEERLGIDAAAADDAPCVRSTHACRSPVAAAVIVGGMYLVFLVDALTRPPSGYDGLHYHLPVAVNWMRWRSLDMVPGLLHQSLPENGMIVPFLLAFVKWEALFPIVHFPKAIVVALAVFGLSRAIGASGRASGVCACIALSIPPVVFQSFSSFIDLYAAASWLSALSALTWAARVGERRRRSQLLLLAGLSAGVALGSKTTYLVMTVMLGAAVMAVDWIARRPGAATLRPTPVRNGLIFGAAALVCSGFWFIRGAVQTGNPVYPLAVSLGGRELLPGFHGEDYASRHRSWARKLGHWWDYPWREPRYEPGYPYGVGDGLGAAYATFVPIGLLAAAGATLRRRPRTPEAKWRLVYAAFVAIGAWLLATVFWELTRYVLPLLLLTVPLAGPLIDRLTTVASRWTALLLSTSLTATAAIASLPPAHTFLGRVRDRNWERSWFYQIPSLIDDLPPGSRILNLDDAALTYPLLGKELDHVVITPTHWELLTADAGAAAARRLSADALRKHDIDYVFVREPWPTDWPNDLPLELIHDDTHTRLLKSTPASRIYRVDRSGP